MIPQHKRMAMGDKVEAGQAAGNSAKIVDKKCGGKVKLAKGGKAKKGSK